MNTVWIPDLDGVNIEAKVGDYILAHDYLSDKICKVKIEAIKKGFRAGHLKITPKPRLCIWLYRLPIPSGNEN